MKNIRERLKEEILLLTDKRMDYVLKHLEEILANEEAEEDQQKEIQQHE